VRFDSALAERQLMECVYILDQLSWPLSSLVPIVSELGTGALLQYAEVLLRHNKHRYARPIWEEAGLVR
jgi:hypothetical protein